MHKPKIIIPIAAVVAIALGIFLYPKVGNAPVTDLQIQDESAEQESNSAQTVNLSFPKSGRVESVLVKQGSIVKKGQTIAILSAPDALGLISQTKGALELAQAQYASLDLEYANAKKQQDLLVSNAYNTLLKTPPEAVANNTDDDHFSRQYPLPIISGNYLLGREGTITIKTYRAAGGLYFTASGLVGATDQITSNPIPLGASGLSITFSANIATDLIWTITLPNTHSASYAANKNAYDLAVANRENILSELAQKIDAGSAGQSVAKAQVDAANGAYQSALGAYQSNVISAPISGVVDFLSEDLKPGQSIATGKTLVSISIK
ncbi:MAG: biotin/lipoyl-binding protein [Patescibacteria group bacterium]